MFCWRGWAGDLFPESLEDIRNKAVPSPSRASSRSHRHSSDSRDDSDESRTSQSTPTSAVDEDLAWSAKDKFYERYFHLSSRQESCLNDFVYQASRPDDDNDDDNDNDNRQSRQARLKRAAVAFAQAVIEQHLAKSPFHSPLVAYVAMRSVAGTSSWMPFGSFNSHLSALIYCGQLWVFRFACNKVDLQTSMPSGSKGRDPDIDDGLDQALDSYMEEFFSNEKSKPYGTILLWRRRLFGGMARETMSNHEADWDPATRTVVTFKGRSISMD